MDMFVERQRKDAVKAMIKAYRPNLPIDFIQNELAFESSEDCVKFLTDLGVTLTADGLKVKCAQSQGVLQA